MRKAFVCLLVAFVIILNFTACGSKENPKVQNPDNNQVNSTENSEENKGTEIEPTEEQTLMYDIRGNWIFEEVTDNDTKRTSVFLFEGEEASGTVTNGTNYEGTYKLESSLTIKPNSGDFKYTGQYINEDHMEGVIVSNSTGSSKGKWAATRDKSIEFDVRGEWIFTSDWNGNLTIGTIVFGEGPANSVSSGMANGSCRINGKTFYNYLISGKIVEFIFKSSANNIRYSGEFVNNELMSGEIYEYEKLIGTWKCERKMD